MKIAWNFLPNPVHGQTVIFWGHNLTLPFCVGATPKNPHTLKPLVSLTVRPRRNSSGDAIPQCDISSYRWCNSLFTPPTRTRQDCFVLFCPCRRCEQLCLVLIQFRRVLSRLDPVSNLHLFNLKYIEDYWKYGNWETGSRRDKTHRNWVKTKQNGLVLSAVVFTPPTRTQDNLVLSASTVRTSYKLILLRLTPQRRGSPETISVKFCTRVKGWLGHKMTKKYCRQFQPPWVGRTNVTDRRQADLP